MTPLQKIYRILSEIEQYSILDHHIQKRAVEAANLVLELQEQKPFAWYCHDGANPKVEYFEPEAGKYKTVDPLYLNSTMVAPAILAESFINGHNAGYKLMAEEFTKQLDIVSQRNYELRMENAKLKEQQVDVSHMVDRFIGWKFPDNFNPDGGIRFTPPTKWGGWPTGTNMLDAVQAKEMFEYVTKK